MLLGVGEELVGLGADFAALVVGELVAHLLDEYQQRPARALPVAAAFGDAPGAFDYGLGLLSMSQTDKNKPLSGKRLREQRILPTPL